MILIVLLVAAALPIVYGTWRLTLGGVRLISIGSADKPLALALAAALALMASLPRLRAAIRGRSPLAFYLLCAFAMWVLALGPEPTIMDRPALSQAPYGWLMRLPGFDGLRVPARFWMMAARVPERRGGACGATGWTDARRRIARRASPRPDCCSTAGPGRSSCSRRRRRARRPPA